MMISIDHIFGTVQSVFLDEIRVGLGRISCDDIVIHYTQLLCFSHHDAIVSKMSVQRGANFSSKSVNERLS